MAVQFLSESKITTLIKRRNILGNNNPYSNLASVAVIAGGGAGSGNQSLNVGHGGGGGGGVLIGSITMDPSLTYTVSIGAGGVGQPLTGDNSYGRRGGNSSLSLVGVGTLLSATGGGGGTAFSGAGERDGGSGGGGGNAGPGTGIAGQGFNGGSGGGGQHYAGGGGGSGAVGVSAPARPDGGIGKLFQGVRYAGGGGGWGSSQGGNNGIGIAGDGAIGRGGNGNGNGGSAGASGAVVFSYGPFFSAVLGPGLTGTTTSAGGVFTTTITSGTGNVTWVIA
jgi:hypothetical protein